MKGKRILIISSEYPPGPGGIGQHAYSLSRGLHRFGHRVEVMTVSDYSTEQAKRDFDARHPFPIIRFPRIGWKTYPRRFSMVLDRVSGGGFDWVFLTGKFSMWTGLVIKTLQRRQKTLAILHGSEVRPSNPLLRGIMNLSVGACDKVVAVSGFTSSLLPQWLRRSKTPSIIPNGIDYDVDAADEDIQAHVLKGDPRLLTVGHVSPRKGQHRVIKALPELVKRFPDVHYHVVGRPVNRERLEKLADSLGVADKVTFHGVAANHSDLAAYYRGADVFMLLSENQPDGDVEGFGIVALEANHFGLPVVGARNCGVEDAVREGVSGLLVDGDDATQIGEAVGNCLLNRDSLGKGCRDWARRHAWDEIIPDYEKTMH
jgi:phosphatidylinositol alpha-1,6-mannosyltransferase